MLPEKTPIFEFLSLQLNQQVLHLQLARPHKANAINREMWFEIGQAYNWINQQDNVDIGDVKENKIIFEAFCL